MAKKEQIDNIYSVSTKIIILRLLLSFLYRSYCQKDIIYKIITD